MGLETLAGVELVRAAPSQLPRKLAGSEVEVALLSSIELQRFGRGLTIIPAGCIAFVGRTLTTRIFSRLRPEQLRTLWVDRESSSAAVFAQVIWACAYRRRLSIIPFDPVRGDPPPDAEAALLAGDRAVTHPPIGFDWQLDLSAMWHEMTGLPMVLAVWAGTKEAHCQDVHQILLAARQNGQQHLEQIAHEYAPAYGWPVDLAVRYLTEDLQFEFTPAHREGLEELFGRAHECKIIREIKPLRYCTA